ncbi:MAG: acetyl-CoA hydrolase/transferase family protein [Acidobacteria bacterium]|nr:acetyl-CoA hydrolase/transferase family protein [Acidobacteriota bacterium]
MFTTVEDAVSLIQPGHRVFIHSVAAAPQMLIKGMVDRASALSQIKVYHLHTEGDAPYARPEHADTFHTNAFFIGSNVRQAIKEGRGSYIPVFLSEVPRLLRQHIVPIDVALVTVSPPDRHGFCSLGTSVDTSKAAIEVARIVIAQVNRHMPRTLGDAQVHISRFSKVVEGHEPLPQMISPPINEIESKIGTHVASLVEDGATLQMGIGSIPNAVLAALNYHKDLGIHTEMFSDGIIPLVKKGIINGRFKKKHRGKIVGTFALGSQALYDFMDDNPAVAMLECSYVNDTAIIRQNPKVTAINSAIEIDLTGQVCADSIGYAMYSGVGGQMDFIRGASLSEGGKAIIALPSVTNKGISRIVSCLKEGAGVVTTRAHVHYVVTEFGIAYLYGKSLKERAAELIQIAHPHHREQLEREMHKICSR